jgi:hypothetical protein
MPHPPSERVCGTLGDGEPVKVTVTGAIATNAEEKRRGRERRGAGRTLSLKVNTVTCPRCSDMEKL